MPRRILWVTTKPPWPVRDGGRLLVMQTLRALAARGAEVTLVAPCRADEQEELTGRLRRVCTPQLVPVDSRLLDLVRGCRDGLPLAVARHASLAVRRRVERLVATSRFDVVQAEQLQALPQCGPARAAGLPVVLRAQNVESDIWVREAARRPLLGPALRHEARSLARWEGAAVRAADATVALTADDALRLGTLAGGGATIVRVTVPFAGGLPQGPRLPGAPAVVLFGSHDWFPNRQGARWFVREAWPRVRSALPGAQLHVFGLDAGDAAGVVAHAAPGDSRTAFADEAIMVVPLRVASGIRMKILEAWARDVPVVATSEAIAGLDAVPGRELLVADDGDEFAAAVGLLHRLPRERRWLAAAGRAALARQNRPEESAAQLLALYAGI